MSFWIRSLTQNLFGFSSTHRSWRVVATHASLFIVGALIPSLATTLIHTRGGMIAFAITYGIICFILMLLLQLMSALLHTSYAADDVAKARVEEEENVVGEKKVEENGEEGGSLFSSSSTSSSSSSASLPPLPLMSSSDVVDVPSSSLPPAPPPPPPPPPTTGPINVDDEIRMAQQLELLDADDLSPEQLDHLLQQFFLNSSQGEVESTTTTTTTTATTTTTIATATPSTPSITTNTGEPLLICPNGHTMYASDYAGGGYANGYYCDDCGLMNRGLRPFCRECTHDICPWCTQRRIERGQLDTSIPIELPNNHNNNNNTIINIDSPSKSNTPPIIFGYVMPSFVFQSRHALEGFMIRLDGYGRHYSLLAAMTYGLVAIAPASLVLAGVYNQEDGGDVARLVFTSILSSSVQMALLSPPQPDAASPTLANAASTFSRAFYLLLWTLALLLLQQQSSDSSSISNLLSYALSRTLPFLPIFFMLGLLPMPHTAVMVTLEQLHVHAFGGTAFITLRGGVLKLAYCLLSCFVCTWLLVQGDKSAICVALATSLAMSLAYLAARWPSDLHLLAIDVFREFKRCARERRSLGKGEKVEEKVEGEDLNSTELRERFTSSSSASARRKAKSINRIASIRKSQDDDDKDNDNNDDVDKDNDNDGNEKKPNYNHNNNNNNNEKDSKQHDVGKDGICSSPYTSSRLKYDFYGFASLFVASFGLSFVLGVPSLLLPLALVVAFVGLVNHVVIAQFRREHALFGLFAWPLLPSKAHFMSEFELQRLPTPAVALFEHAHRWLSRLERFLLLPSLLMCVAQVTYPYLRQSFSSSSPVWAAFVLVLLSFKLTQQTTATAASSPSLSIVLTLIFFHFDIYQQTVMALSSSDWSDVYFAAPSAVVQLSAASKSIVSSHLVLSHFALFLLISTIAVAKLHELLKKFHFCFCYMPVFMSAASDLHALLMFLALPHLQLHLVMIVVGTLLSLPLLPVAGSVFYLLSYARPVRWTEATFKSAAVKRAEQFRLADLGAAHHNTDRAHLDRANALFYEHISMELQKTLARDLVYGRYGAVTAGDMFVLMSDKLVAFLHLIEVGDGLASFQLRGLELQGTYCQQQEVEALWGTGRKYIEAAKSARWRLRPLSTCVAAVATTWHIQSRSHLLPSYSIANSSALSLFNSFDMRESFASMVTMTLLFHVLSEGNQEQTTRWLAMTEVREALRREQRRSDDDVCVDLFSGDLSRGVFRRDYGDWCRRVCNGGEVGESLLRLLHLLTLFVRRNLVPDELSSEFWHSRVVSPHHLLRRINALLLKDVRFDSADAFLYADVEPFAALVCQALRQGLRLHMETVALYAGQSLTSMSDDERQELHTTVFEMLEEFNAPLRLTSIVCHERDLEWRRGILQNVPEMLSIRSTVSAYSHEYECQFIRCMFRAQAPFTLARVNSEAVRALWAAQQQEIILFGSNDGERGSIQNMIGVLRNMSNQALDPPLGYPIYVSPILNSYFH